MTTVINVNSTKADEQAAMEKQSENQKPLPHGETGEREREREEIGKDLKKCGVAELSLT